MSESDLGPAAGRETSPESDAESLVAVDGLKKYYDSDKLIGGSPVKAVDGVSFEIARGETFGLVGESGCGKTTLGRSVLQLEDVDEGSVVVDGTDVTSLRGRELKQWRRNAQMVFQNPSSAINERMTVGEIVREPLDIYGEGSKSERREKVSHLLDRVGLQPEHYYRYPHQFSGGQRQRIGIARALALEPDFLVLDEPTSALDVSVQAQILNLLSDLQAEFDLTYLLISHDLSVIRHISDRVAVMYLGEIVEIGPAAEIFENPQHPYTQALLESVPRASTAESEREIETLSGDVPSPRDPPSGCRFRTRCPKVIPPADLDIDQEAYRAVMDLRQAIENRAFDIEGIEDRISESESDADTQAVIDRIKDRVVDVQLPARHDELVEEALRAVADEQWAEAEETLAAEYESVCETTAPELGDGEHRAACHLLDDRGRPATDAEAADAAGDD